MITEKDLQEAIAECQGTRNPDARTCLKLASYLTIKEHLYPQEDAQPKLPMYSYAESPKVDYMSDSEFLRAADGKDIAKVWAVMDELMNTLQVIQPRLYYSVIRKIDSI